MSWAIPTVSPTQPFTGEVYFCGSRVRAELVSLAEQDGMLVVAVPAVGPASRGRLGLLLEESVERALELRGAAPPGVGVTTNLADCLSDQLYRARLVELRGFAMVFPEFGGLCDLGGALDPDDSSILRWWLTASTQRPIRLFFDHADRRIGVYMTPCPLGDVATSICRPEADAAPASSVTQTHSSTEEALAGASPEMTSSARTMELSAPPPPVSLAASDTARTLAEALFGESLPGPGPVQLELPLAQEQVEENDDTDTDAGEAYQRWLAGDVLDFASAPSNDVPSLAPPSLEAFSTPPQPEAVEALETPTAEVAPSEPAEPAEAASPVAHAEPAPRAPAPSVLGPRATEQWRTWSRELEAAQGPKPLAAIERMFVSSYVPLADALARGLDDPGASQIASSWTASFERSYKDAFDALKHRGKRPTMVLDVPDLALRIGRLHGARSVQLLLVDGMRFDLGMRVQDRLRPQLGQRAALTERLLLWAALPSVTEVQLELIGRGPDGLRGPQPVADSEIPVARGRAAATPRRVKAGHRDVMKLDLVEAAMSEPGLPLAERLELLAEETAQAIGQHLLKQQPRTLVMVFGDHGFVVDSLENGTSAARHGGASPEEVLVPAFAWLVGNVH